MFREKESDFILNPAELNLINSYLNDAVMLNDKIIAQIEYISECFKDNYGLEEEKIRRVCKQLVLVSEVLKEITCQSKKQQCILAHLFSLSDPVEIGTETIQSNEKIKKQISEDIFHSIGQTLFSLHLSLFKLNALQMDEALRSQLKSLEGVVNDTLQKAKDAATELYPLVLDDLGIVPTIKSYLAYLVKKEYFNFPYMVAGKLNRYSTEAEIVIFRTCQELFHQIMKNTSTRNLTLFFNETDLLIKVEFNGQGKLMNLVENMKKIGWDDHLLKVSSSWNVQENEESYLIEIKFNKLDVIEKFKVQVK